MISICAWYALTRPKVRRFPFSPPLLFSSNSKEPICYICICFRYAISMAFLRMLNFPHQSTFSNKLTFILNHLGSNFIKLPCHHLFCVKCMETLCRMHVKEGTLFQLVCPDSKCNASIPHYLLKRLLSEEDFERWDRLALDKALDSMEDVVYCPKCVIGCVEDEDNNAQCPKCSFIFCGFCKELWHPGKQCLTPEQKLHRRKVRLELKYLQCKQGYAVYFYSFYNRRRQVGWLRGRWQRNCWTSKSCTGMFGYVQIAELPSPRVKAATKWCVAIVVNSFASVAARQSLATIISGRQFILFFVFKQGEHPWSLSTNCRNCPYQKRNCPLTFLDKDILLLKSFKHYTRPLHS